METESNEINTEQFLAEHILYAVVLPRNGSGEFSPFQGFSINIFPVTNIIQHICTLPTSIGELFRTRDEALTWRAIGLAGYAIALLELEYLSEFDGGLPITCFVSDSESRVEVDKYLAQKGRTGWLHLTTDEASTSTPTLWNFSRAEAHSCFQKRAEKIIAERFAGSPELTSLPRRALVPWPEQTVQLEKQYHNITLPTETALLSLQFRLGEASKPLAGNGDDDFAVAISAGASELERIRQDAGADQHRIPGSPTLIVTVPSVYRHLSPNQLGRKTTPAFRKAFRNVIRQSQYVAMRSSSADQIKELTNDRAALALLQLRAKELTVYTAALSVAASSLGIPVLRCPPQVDRVRELLIRLAGMTRSENPNLERRNSLARNIGDSLRGAIPNLLLKRIEQHQDDGIKLIGDTPLELIPINDLPLGLRATVSRMPTLPGNLLMRQGLLRTPMLLKSRDLTRVLIVRSFDHHDPLRNLLVDAIKLMNSESQKKLEVEVVDVRTKEEFIAAFNRFDGKLAIFDGHGVHQRSDPQGTIRIGSIPVNPFELYGQINIPPILFLSACETHTLEGIESSVASAFLMMGARSVLGTMVPISGLKAAILIGRFMFRFTDFVPLLRTMISWSQVVSGMLRMSYVTDVLRTFEKQYSLCEDDYYRIHSAANIAINQFQSRWFEQVLSSVSEAISMPESDVRRTWLRRCYFSETLHYVHLGQPEHLFIVP